MLMPDLTHPQNSQQDLRLDLNLPLTTSLSFLPAWINQGSLPAGNSLTYYPSTLSQILRDPNSCKPSFSSLPFQA